MFPGRISTKWASTITILIYKNGKKESEKVLSQEKISHIIIEEREGKNILNHKHNLSSNQLGLLFDLLF